MRTEPLPLASRSAERSTFASTSADGPVDAAAVLRRWWHSAGRRLSGRQVAIDIDLLGIDIEGHMPGVKASEVDARPSVQALGAAFELYRRGFASAIDSRRDHQRQPDRLLRQSRIVHHDVERAALDACCALANAGGQRQCAFDGEPALARARLTGDLDRVCLQSRRIASDIGNGERELKWTATAPLCGKLDALACGLPRRNGEPRSGQPHFEWTTFGLDIQRSL